MKWQRFPKSPVFPADTRWEPKKRKGGYESDATRLINSLLDNDAVREDQAKAWERWRNDEDPLRNKAS
ncbi:MAG TPA: hypothetical protein VNT02_10730 [Burkholderiales bacterium]|nr:hypothetical protein [Burkholderiales bacterium]